MMHMHVKHVCMQECLKIVRTQDLVREICCIVADAAPEFGIGVLIMDLLNVDASSWDALMIGLRALLCVLLAVPSRKAGQVFITEVRRFAGCWGANLAS